MEEPKKNNFKIVKFDSAIYLKETILDKKFVSSLENVKLKKYKDNHNNYFDGDKDQVRTALIGSYLQPHIHEIFKSDFALNRWWIQKYEKELLDYAHQQLQTIEGMRFIGNAQQKAGAVSFLINDIHPYDIGMILDKLGIAVRTGHHCAQPVMDEFNIPGTIRASFAVYNTKEELDILVKGLKKAKSMLE